MQWEWNRDLVADKAMNVLSAFSKKMKKNAEYKKKILNYYELWMLEREWSD